MEPCPLGLLLLVLILCSYSGHAADPPIATVAVVSPQPPYYAGDKVTLRCDIAKHTYYYWYKGNNQINNQKTLIIHLPDHGQYTCQGYRSDRNLYSQRSAPVSISVTALPTATVTVESPEGPYYPGDEVTLRCDVVKYSDWYWYSWYQDGYYVKTEGRQAITFSLSDEAGQYLYTCRGTREKRPKTSQHSTAASISARSFPVPTLTVHPSPAFTGETVTLTCVIQPSTGWTYAWDNPPSSKASKPNSNIYTISRATVSDQGKYKCYGVRERSRKSSPYSNTVQLTVEALPVATLTVEPQSPVFTGETVTMKCVIESLSGWTYKWYKDSSTTPVSEGNTFTIRGATESHKGQYWCQGERGYRPTTSQPSRRITLDVKAPPLATLTVEPQSPVFTGETVTLTCVIESLSGWTYKWYKESSTTPVSEGNTFTIRGADEFHMGQYWCQGERIDRPTLSQPSRRITLDVKASKPKLTLSPAHQLLTGDSVTLRCELGVSSGLVFNWYRHTQNSDPVNQTDGDSYSISSVNISDEGQYWCRAGRGVFYIQYSDAAEIKVTDAGSSKSMVTVGGVIRLLLAFALIILMVLMYCSQKAKGSVSVMPNPGLQQSDSHSPTSQNRVLGGAVAGTSDVVYDEIELQDTL
ncbi:basement membrane-specific heparan sulfate proteoglycan core protein-like [Sardina pilchardus]|uniref:basement membrane-specific heparan sulfate proteoglycan core protein-like n=1 Tax=Sardina pilchardus TaxID=27697 RepID=UPI002E125E58